MNKFLGQINKPYRSYGYWD